MDYLIPAPRAALHVSVSQVRSYILCPKRYEFKYVLGAEPESKSGNLVIGLAVHSALAEYHAVIKRGDPPMVLEELVAVMEKSFYEHAAQGPGVLLDEGETLDDLKGEAERLLTVFIKEVAMRPLVADDIVGVEVPFSVDVIDPATGEILEEMLVGYLDAVIKVEGKVVVVEHKTSNKAWSYEQLAFDLQVALYQAATDASAVRLQVLVKTKVAKLMVHDVVRSKDQQAEAVSVVVDVLKGIRAGAFWKNRGWQCKECEFKGRCGP